MADSFANQAVLVTGGSSGIGAASALQFARGGAKVLITGREEDKLHNAAREHANIDYCVSDVAKPADVARVIEQVKSRWGRLDVLVNNAGICEIAPLSDASAEHVGRTLAINVAGLIEMTRSALPLLLASKGSVVNVASTIADQPFANMSVYCASKAAVVALTRAWAQELGAQGVRVNAVSPGPIETPLFQPSKLGISAEQLASMGQQITQLVPMGRFGKPEEVAQVVAFLASAAASYVTGAQYTVGGGIEA
jgi:NAD(P)-dependent dehydrogenase (short-subunit alcohol dehydrogenase family)